MDPPPPYSALTPPTELPAVSRWHPKMSPYRVFVMTTTILLGTLKAVFAYRGILNFSTTFEWIGGVVFTLLFFVLDEWESKESFPKSFQWFYNFDCMDLMWGALRVFSVSQPKYRSDIVPNESPENITFVPITGYRILVSATVVVLGSVKATLAYLGHNTTANSFDWTMAVFMTSLLYYIGLYESNSVDLAPNFFVHDHNAILSRVFRDILVMFALGATMYISIKGTSYTLSGFKDSLHTVTTKSSEVTHFAFLQSLDMFMLCVWTFLLSLSLSAVVATAITIVWTMRKESEFFVFLFRRGRFAKTYDDTIAWVLSVAAALLNPAQRVVYIVLWISAHLLGITTLGSLIGILISAMQAFGENFNPHDGFSGKLSSALTLEVLFGGFTIAALCGIYYLVRSLVLPFPLFARTLGFV